MTHHSLGRVVAFTPLCRCSQHLWVSEQGFDLFDAKFSI